MKLNKLTVVIALLLVALCAGFAAQAEEKKAELPAVPKGAVRSTMTVGYCCENCADHVKDALAELKGVVAVYTDVPAKKCTVDYKEKVVTLRRIKDKILETGYSVDGEEPKAPHGEG